MMIFEKPIEKGVHKSTKTKSTPRSTNHSIGGALWIAGRKK
jgi:hypothetical protein